MSQEYRCGSCLQLWSFKLCGFCLYGKTERIHIWDRSTYRVGLYLFLIIRDVMSVVAVIGDPQLNGTVKHTGDNTRILNSHRFQTLKKLGLGKDAEKSTASLVSLETHVFIIGVQHLIC